MAYTTGSANNFSELRTALSAFLTGNGWTDQSGYHVPASKKYAVLLQSTETPAATNGLSARAYHYKEYTTPSAHRYWRISFGANNGGSETNAVEIEMRTSAGGADQTGSGVASASSQWSASSTATQAFDNNTATYWSTVSGSPTNGWIQYDFGAGNKKAIVEFTWSLAARAVGYGPRDFTLWYSDDGVAWEASFSGDMGAWVLSTPKTMKAPVVGAPVYYSACPNASYLSSPSSAVSFDISWPVTYHGFLNSSPDEVFMVAVDGNQRVYYVAFGDSDIPHQPGDGVWQAGTARSDFRNDDGLTPIGIRAPDVGQGYSRYSVNCMPFWGASVTGAPSSQRNYDASWVFMGGAWTYTGTGELTSNAPPNRVVSTRYFDYNLYNLLPNAWNTETVLLPYKCYASPIAASTQLVLDFRTLRKCRTDNFENGNIVEFAGDKWMIFSIFQKDVANRNGSNTATGTHGIALHYDGP